jgi:hypothetical protein
MSLAENPSLTPVFPGCQDNGGCNRKSVSDPGFASLNLCRAILFVCPRCEPQDGHLYTLPQATAIGNAFFAFQRRLLDQAGA